MTINVPSSGADESVPPRPQTLGAGEASKAGLDREVSRRDFLKGVLVGGAVAVLSPRELFGAEADRYSDAQLRKLTKFALDHGIVTENDLKALVHWVHDNDHYYSIDDICNRWKGMKTSDIKAIIDGKASAPMFDPDPNLKSLDDIMNSIK